MGNRIEDIIIAVLNGEKLSREEVELFDEWYAQPRNKKRFYEWQCLQSAIYANRKSSEIGTEEAWKQLKRGRRLRIFRSTFLKYAAAAFILMSIGVASYRLYQQPSPISPVSLTANAGKGKQVVLTLSTGEQIPLSDSLAHSVIEECGITIRRNAEHGLVYDKTAESKEPLYNTISIPRGGEYKLTLSDGTNVWLNSESRLTYPVTFNGESRELKLEGEAFFEVAKDPAKPFIVHTHEFDIRVTGTQFNVRVYPDEPESATLAEGYIQLEKGNEVHRLVAGEQAVTGEQGIVVHKVNPEEAIAWRYEAFCFKKRRLENMMNELARWYDIDIFYQNPTLKELHFTAWFSRSSSITEVIRILEKTEKIKLELRGKTMMVRMR